MRIRGLTRFLKRAGKSPPPRTALREATFWDDPRCPDADELSPEEFQAELAVLGLSGRRFDPEDYREALETRLGIPILVRVFPDADYPEVARQLARSGSLAEVCCSEEPPSAVILVPESLPPLVRTLALYHELGHLAAGHAFGGGIADSPPSRDDELREKEADLRAYYALAAGSLGSSNPYAARMYDVL